MQLEVGSIYEGKVTKLAKFGAFVDLGGGTVGMVHISEISPTFVKEIGDHLTEGQQIKVKVLTIGEDGKIGLSVRKAMENAPPAPKRPEPASFEDMLSKFKMTSDERISDLKRSVETKRGSSPSKRGAK